MAARCKVGDLAVCIAGTATGTFVTVRSPAEHPQERIEPAWLCVVSAECVALRTYTNGLQRSITVPRAALVVFLDRHLQPIRPPKPPQATPAPPIEVEHAY